MRSLGFYALSNAWLLALLGPLVLLYFLKLKRTRVAVPSLVLWRQVISDRRVNTPFQRFKRNLLLLLQIALLVLLALGAMQPFWRARRARVRRLPVLVDCSASMGALDRPGGKTRLALAKEKVSQIIEGLLPDQEICLISFARTARKRCDFTNDKRLLRRALEEIELREVPGDVEEALRMSQALARGTAFQEVLVLSDGNFPTRVHFDLSFELNYQRLPAGGPNVGITELNARRTPQGDWHVFTSVAASSRGMPATVRLLRDGEPVAEQRAVPSPDQPERIVFRLPAREEASVEARLVPDGFDALAADNTAYLHLPAGRPLHVFAPTQMAAFRHALRACPDVVLHDEKDEQAGSAYDLVVSDRREDTAAAGRTRCYVGLVPADLSGAISVEKEPAAVVDWRRGSPLLQYVELSDVVILEEPTAGQGVAEGTYEELGWEVLIHGQAGPLLLRRQEGERLTYYFLFHTDRSTLPYRVGFPVVVSNLVQLAMERAGLAEVRPRRTGLLDGVRLEPQTAYVVQGPDRSRQKVTSDAEGMLPALPAPRAGIYRVMRGGRTHATLPASLLSGRETGLAAVAQLEFDEDLTVEASATGVRMDRALWPLLAALAFCLMMGEWWYYHRRPGGYG